MFRQNVLLQEQILRTLKCRESLLASSLTLAQRTKTGDPRPSSQTSTCSTRLFVLRMTGFFLPKTCPHNIIKK